MYLMLYKVLPILFFLLIVHPIFGQTSNLHLNKCWDLAGEDIDLDVFASDNDTLLFFKEGKLISTDYEKKFLWSNESLISLKPRLVIIKDEVIYTENNKNSENPGIIIRGISKTTGLNTWIKQINTSEITEVKGLYIFKEKIAFIQESMKLLLIDLDTKTTISNNKISQFPIVDLIQNEDVLYFIDSQRNLLRYDINKSQSEILTKLNSDNNKIVNIDTKTILISNSKGEISNFSLLSNRLIWTSRMGASISSVTKYVDDFLVSSLDNYIYFISGKNGEYKWKKRLTSRNIGILDEDNEIYFSILLNQNLGYLIEPRTGKIITQINLPEDQFFTGKPIQNGTLIILPNSKGFSAYSFKECKKSRT